MQETPMLFPVAPSEFWKQLQIIIEDVITEKIQEQISFQANSLLPERALLKPSDICSIFHISKPTLYEWIKRKKIKSFKIMSRRYFAREAIEEVMRGKQPTTLQ